MVMRLLAERMSAARATFFVLVILGIVTGFVFAADPALDLQVAAFFRDVAARPEVQPLFRIIEVVRGLGPVAIIAATAPAVLTLAIKAFRPKRWARAPMSSRAALFLVLSLNIGPGLLVNGLLKEGWGRPRPRMVTEFGGDHAFRPWWDPRGTCDSNCSFVSGETSSAVWMTAPAMLAPPPWRSVALGAALLYGAAVATMRLLASGHFLSDVIFAGIFTGLVIWTVHGMLYRWSSTRPEDRAIDGMLARIGSAIMRPFGGARAPDGRHDKQTPV
jgi:lipid A 4'-phosphatase